MTGNLYFNKAKVGSDEFRTQASIYRCRKKFIEVKVILEAMIVKASDQSVSRN